jgi:hypothetical protein
MARVCELEKVYLNPLLKEILKTLTYSLYHQAQINSDYHFVFSQEK